MQPCLSTPHVGRIYLFRDTNTFIGTRRFLFAHIKADHALTTLVVSAVWALLRTILNEMSIGFSTPQLADGSSHFSFDFSRRAGRGALTISEALLSTIAFFISSVGAFFMASIGHVIKRCSTPSGGSQRLHLGFCVFTVGLVLETKLAKVTLVVEATVVVIRQ